ncbi:MAG: hypothetical protein K2I95_10540 [Treponemataceae bacterium]|nr:hypothetical protein [Treponemataceae bacterium]
MADDVWLDFCGDGFYNLAESAEEEKQDYIDVNPIVLNPKPIVAGNFLDTYGLEQGLYAYRIIGSENKNPAEEDWEYSNWVRNGGEAKIGYTFGNYKVPEGQWGTVVTEDDIRYTYLWGTDFKATNGQSFTDGQIKFYIDAATEEIARMLNITIRKKKIRCNAETRKLEKGVDYDIDEAFYDFKFQKISRYGLIRTRERPIAKLHAIKIIRRGGYNYDITKKVFVDKTKGVIKLLERPIRPSETWSGIATAINPYGNQSLNPNMFYSIDYDAGFESSDDIPADLRQIVAKQAAISLLNIIGDGLMSGFSSSSLSMDGLSESFSSTQSATSAYFGARIKVYQDEVAEYVKNNRCKFNSLPMGSI